MLKQYFKPIFAALLSLLCIVEVQAKTYMVSVGISDYNGRANNLAKCVGDAQAVKNLYDENSQVESVLLTDSEATADNIVKILKSTFSQAEEDDIILFFFSGHGYGNGFLSYDGILSYDTIRKVMAKSKAKNKIIFADACYSGNIRTAKKDQNTREDDKKYNIMLFLSSRHDEFSLMYPNLKNSLFTFYLLLGLKGDADKNKDNVITAKETFDYVYPSVVKHAKNSNRNQHPTMWGNFSDDMQVMRLDKGDISQGNTSTTSVTTVLNGSGNNVTVSGNNVTVSGNNVIVSGDGNVVVSGDAVDGNSSVTTTTDENGNTITVVSGNNGNNNVIIGNGSSITGNGNITIGNGTSVSVGNGNVSNGSKKVKIVRGKDGVKIYHDNKTDK